MYDKQVILCTLTEKLMLKPLSFYMYQNQRQKLWCVNNFRIGL